MREQTAPSMTSSESSRGFGFNHHHGIAGGGDNQIEIAFGGLFLLGVEDVFAIDITDARSADRAHEGNARNGQRSRSCDHRQNIGLDFAIIAQHLRDDVDFVVETFGEQRTDRTVDQAGNQRFLFGRAAFTLEEAAGMRPAAKNFS
jgi:hypothetical protein